MEKARMQVEVKPLDVDKIVLPESCSSLPWDYVPGTEEQHAVVMARNEISSLAAMDSGVSVQAMLQDQVVGYATLYPLTWDSQVYGMAMGRISGVYVAPGDRSFDIYHALFAYLQVAAESARIQHVDLPLRVSEVTAVAAACSLGWRAVACNLGMTWDLTQPLPGKNARSVKIRHGEAKDEIELARLAMASIDTFSRFVADPLLPQDRVSSAFREWAVNALHGRADCVDVAEVENKLVGYCTWRMNPAYESVTAYPLAILDLTAVHEKARRRGVLSALIRAGLSYCQENGVGRAEVFTNVLNGGMQRGCTLMGATTRTARYSLHWAACDKLPAP